MKEAIVIAGFVIAILVANIAPEAEATGADSVAESHHAGDDRAPARDQTSG